MKKITRTFSCILAGALMVSFLSTDVKAAQAGVSIDEAVYVNMDYYGKTNNISIVKGCNLNGNSSFTDYGPYDKVTNMSNEVKPNISDGSVSWNIPEIGKRFYYECTPKRGTVTLPWDFDISYKLNGVPANAEKLAGASGLVEINIKAKPNKKANTYLRNNMILMVETTVDMSDAISIEAPGAQLQSVGTYKAVLFAGLPGEENNFTIRIGTKKFETTGIMMTMLPGTLDQLTDIKELKEDKDTIEDSAKDVYNSLNEILNTIQSTSSGLGQVKSGISSLDGARRKISTSKDGLYADADKSLADLVSTTKQINDLIPHLQNGQQMVNDVNRDVNALISTMNNTKPYIDSFIESITRIQNDTDSLCNNLDEIKSYSEERKKISQQLITDIGTAQNDLNAMQSGTFMLRSTSSQLQTDLSNMDNAIKSMPAQLDAASKAAKTLYNDTTVPILNGELKSILAALEPATKDLTNVVSSIVLISDKLYAMSANGQDVLSLGNRTVTMVENYFTSLDKGIDSTQDLLKQANNIGAISKDVLTNSSELIDNASLLNDTINKYKDGTVKALKDTETLLGGFATGLTDTQVFLTSLETIMKSSGNNLDEGTRKSLNGLIDLLQKSLKGIGTTSTVKNANDTIKKTYDDKMNEIEKDSNLLYMDAKAAPISFTSSKNPSPQSIQVIMRTQEISIDENKSSADLEKVKGNPGFISRIANVFTEIWDKIKSIFS